MTHGRHAASPASAPTPPTSPPRSAPARAAPATWSAHNPSACRVPPRPRRPRPTAMLTVQGACALRRPVNSRQDHDRGCEHRHTRPVSRRTGSTAGRPAAARARRRRTPGAARVGYPAAVRADRPRWQPAVRFAVAGRDELPAGAQLPVAVAVAAVVVTGLAAVVLTGGAAPAGAGVAIRLVPVAVAGAGRASAERRVQPAAVEPLPGGVQPQSSVTMPHCWARAPLPRKPSTVQAATAPKTATAARFSICRRLSCRASPSPTRSTVVIASPSPSALPLVPVDAVARRHDRGTRPAGAGFRGVIWTG